jgi:ribosomal protein L21E
MRIGDRVRIVKVQFPEHEHHARYIGATGIVKRIYKTKPFVTVEIDGMNKQRECRREFLEVLQ